jgi:uncharacterized membrane protein HdeD (DUF308 family)
MFIASTNLDINAIASRWWMLVVRGLAAIAFGVLAIAWPRSSLLALVLLWGAYALVDGVFSIALAARSGAAGGRWGWLFFEGLVGIGAAFVTFFWPSITGLALLMLIAAWAVITGAAEIVAAVELRHVIRGEWLLGLAGVLSIAFGVLMMLYPGAGALAVLAYIAAYAIVFGVVLVALGFRIHHWATHGEHPMTGGAPTHA